MALPRCFRGRKTVTVTLRIPDLMPLNPNLVRVRHRGFVRYANSIPEAFLIHYFTVLQIHKPRLLLRRD